MLHEEKGWCIDDGPRTALYATEAGDAEIYPVSCIRKKNVCFHQQLDNARLTAATILKLAPSPPHSYVSRILKTRGHAETSRAMQRGQAFFVSASPKRLFSREINLIQLLVHRVLVCNVMVMVVSKQLFNSVLR